MSQVNSGKSGQKWRVYMDFAPAKKAGSVARPGAQGVARPVARPMVQQPRMVKRAARPAAVTQVRPNGGLRPAQVKARPMSAEMRQAQMQMRVGGRVTTAKRAEATPKRPPVEAERPKFVARPAEQPEPQRPLSQPRPRPQVRAAERSGASEVPYVQQTVTTETQVVETPRGRLIEQESYEEIDFGVIEDHQSSEGEKGAVAETKPSDAASNWPFLKSVNVEKRPLSGKAAAQKKAEKPQSTTITPAASSIALNSGVTRKKSKLPMIGLLILTIVLGAAVGAAVYFAIFQGGGPG